MKYLIQWPLWKCFLYFRNSRFSQNEDEWGADLHGGPESPPGGHQSGPSSAYRPSHTKSHCKIAGSNLAEEKYHKSVPKWDGSAFKTKPQIISRTAKKIVNQPERERVDKTVDKTPRVAVTPPAPPETWLLYSPRVGNRTKSLLSVFVWSRDADYAGIQARLTAPTLS